MDNLDILREEMGNLKAGGALVDIIMNECGTMVDSLRRIEGCWETWKTYVPEDVTWNDLDMGRMFEVLAIMFLADIDVEPIYALSRPRTGITVERLGKEVHVHIHRSDREEDDMVVEFTFIEGEPYVIYRDLNAGEVTRTTARIYDPSLYGRSF